MALGPLCTYFFSAPQKNLLTTGGLLSHCLPLHGRPSTCGETKYQFETMQNTSPFRHESQTKYEANLTCDYVHHAQRHQSCTRAPPPPIQALLPTYALQSLNRIQIGMAYQKHPRLNTRLDKLCITLPNKTWIWLFVTQVIRFVKI